MARKPSQRLDINARTVERAIRESVPGAARYDITDTKASGLTIQVGPQGGVWHYRYEKQGRSCRFHLGALVDWSAVEAREIAADAAAHRRLGGTIDDAWFDAQLVKRGKKAAPALVPVQSWDWATARDLYLDEVKRVNKPKTYRDYRSRLTNTPELARFEGRQVATITRREATRAVQDIHKRGVEAHAEHLAANISAFFTWLGKDARSDETGVEPGRMTSLEVPARTMRAEVVKKKYAPPLHEVGRLMAIARSGAVNDRIGLAIELLVFSVQRVTFVVHARVDAMEAAVTAGEGLWIMDPYHRKTALRRDDTTDHVVPLPTPAWRAVTRAMDLTEHLDHARVFPGLRPQKGGGVVDALSESVIQHTMSYMPGIVATPHDLRRSFSKHGQTKFQWGLDGTKSILDHNEGQSSDDVTIRSYLHNGDHAKWAIMRKWCAWVEEVTAEALAFDNRLHDVQWLKAHIDKRRREHKTGKRDGVTLAKDRIPA